MRHERVIRSLTGLFFGFCWLLQYVLMHAAFTAARNCAICLSKNFSDGAGTAVEFGRLYHLSCYCKLRICLKVLC